MINFLLFLGCLFQLVLSGAQEKSQEILIENLDKYSKFDFSTSSFQTISNILSLADSAVELINSVDDVTTRGALEQCLADIRRKIYVRISEITEFVLNSKRHLDLIDQYNLELDKFDKARIAELQSIAKVYGAKLDFIKGYSKNFDVLKNKIKKYVKRIYYIPPVLDNNLMISHLNLVSKYLKNIIDFNTNEKCLELEDISEFYGMRMSFRPKPSQIPASMNRLKFLINKKICEINGFSCIAKPKTEKNLILPKKNEIKTMRSKKAESTIKESTPVLSKSSNKFESLKPNTKSPQKFSKFNAFNEKLKTVLKTGFYSPSFKKLFENTFMSTTPKKQLIDNVYNEIKQFKGLKRANLVALVRGINDRAENSIIDLNKAVSLVSDWSGNDVITLRPRKSFSFVEMVDPKEE